MMQFESVKEGFFSNEAVPIYFSLVLGFDIKRAQKHSNQLSEKLITVRVLD